MAVAVQIPVSENPRKRRKFASPWDVPPAQFKSCDESSSKKRLKMTSPWDVPPLLLQFQCDFFQPGPIQQSSLISISSIPESQKATVKENGQRLSRDLSHALRADDKDDRIVSKMGEGTFGQVVECWDRKQEDHVAIKIVRGQPKYKEEAIIEIEMNQKISKSQRSLSRSWVELLLRHLECWMYPCRACHGRHIVSDS